MGMTTGGGNKKQMSEINVTPLVDVMLVLLIIFMVATPIIVEDQRERVLDIDLPVTQNQPVTFNPEERLMLQVDANLRVYIGDELITDCSSALESPGPESYETCFEDIERLLLLNPWLNEDQRLYLLADASIPYGFVVGAMNRIRLAGVTNVGMVTNPEYLTAEQRGL